MEKSLTQDGPRTTWKGLNLPALERFSVAFGHTTLWKVIFLTLIYLDLVLTLVSVNSGFRELNPIVAALIDRPVELFLLKGVLPAVIAWMVPAQLLVPSIGFWVLVVGWNIAVMAGMA